MTTPEQEPDHLHLPMSFLIEFDVCPGEGVSRDDIDIEAVEAIMEVLIEFMNDLDPVLVTRASMSRRFATFERIESDEDVDIDVRNN